MTLFKSAATVSALTLISRITGLIRETLTASIFGAGPQTDAFIVAFRLPNLLRRLFAEGAFTQAFVPILAGTREASGEREARRIVDAVATVLFWSLLVVSIVGAIAAPVLVWMVASGLAADPKAFHVATVMTRWMFPYILMISLVALAAGVLNTWRHFAVPAFAPVLLNVCFIAAALLLTPYFDPPIYALAAGVIVGGIAQVALQAVALARLGLLPRISVGVGAAWRDPVVRQVIRQMGPAVLAVSVAQLSLIIIYPDRLVPASRQRLVDQLQRSVDGVPDRIARRGDGTVLMPSLSRASRAGQTERYEALIDWGLRLLRAAGAAGDVGAGAAAEPITALVFHHGRFSDFDVAMTARAPSSPTRRACSAWSQSRSSRRPSMPARIFVPRSGSRSGVLLLTQLMNAVFVPWIAHAGLALAISAGPGSTPAGCCSGCASKACIARSPAGPDSWRGSAVALTATGVCALVAGAPLRLDRFWGSVHWSEPRSCSVSSWRPWRSISWRLLVVGLDPREDAAAGSRRRRLGLRGAAMTDSRSPRILFIGGGNHGRGDIGGLVGSSGRHVSIADRATARASMPPTGRA
jgi:putative peptidoglycan lipid II flippase